MSRRRKLVAAAVVCAALGFLLYQGLVNAAVYFKTADQAVADRVHLGSRTFRIEGTVEHDVVRTPTATEFDIFANGATVRIVDTGQPPELFRPGIPVVLDGHWDGPVYAANEIMVKHTASYVEDHPNRLKPQLPGASS